MTRNQFHLRPLVFAAVLALSVYPAHSCSWAVRYFHQVTCLRGTVVGMSHGWPRWLQQHISRDNVKLRLYQYRWPVRDRSEMPFVKSVTTDEHGRFDFGDLSKGHYTLVIDWPSDYAASFDVEITSLSKPTVSVKIDVSPVSPDCTGGHEFISLPTT